MTVKEHFFRVMFTQRDQLCELYAKQLAESDMYGFIVIEELVLPPLLPSQKEAGETRQPNEFEDVIRTYLPVHSIVRIDEVEKVDETLPLNPIVGQSNIHLFPQQPSKNK